MWRFAIPLTLLAVVLAPQGGQEGRTDGCITYTPLSYVHEKVLDYDFLLNLQQTTQNPHLVVPYLKPNREDSVPAHKPAKDAVMGDILTLNNATLSGTSREAKVLVNTASEFRFVERLPYLQRVTHIMTFEPYKDEKEMAVFQHQRKWQGCMLVQFLRHFGFMSSDAPWGAMSSVMNAGTEVLRVNVNEAWEKEAEKEKYLVGSGS